MCEPRPDDSAQTSRDHLRRHSVFLKYSRERAPPGCAPTHAASPSRGWVGEFRKGCRPSSRESGKIRVVPSGSSFFENFSLKRVKHKYKCDNTAFLVEDACYFDFFIFSRSTREITQTTSRDPLSRGEVLVLKKRIDDRCRHQSNQAASCQRSAISRVGARPR